MKAKVVFKPYNLSTISLPVGFEANNTKISCSTDVLGCSDLPDISDILAIYKGGGTSSYHPWMLLKALLLAYFNNIYS